jgi:hypothetical protein
MINFGLLQGRELASHDMQPGSDFRRGEALEALPTEGSNRWI